MDNSKIDATIMSLKDKVDVGMLPFVRDRLTRANDGATESLMFAKFVSPIAIFLFTFFLGVFAVDRFMLKKFGSAVTKLILCISFYVLCFVSNLFVASRYLGMATTAGSFPFVSLAIIILAIPLGIWQLVDLCTSFKRAKKYNLKLVNDTLDLAGTAPNISFGGGGQGANTGSAVLQNQPFAPSNGGVGQPQNFAPSNGGVGQPQNFANQKQTFSPNGGGQGQPFNTNGQFFPPNNTGFSPNATVQGNPYAPNNGNAQGQPNRTNANNGGEFYAPTSGSGQGQPFNQNANNGQYQFPAQNIPNGNCQRCNPNAINNTSQDFNPNNVNTQGQPFNPNANNWQGNPPQYGVFPSNEKKPD